MFQAKGIWWSLNVFKFPRDLLLSLFNFIEQEELEKRRSKALEKMEKKISKAQRKANKKKVKERRSIFKKISRAIEAAEIEATKKSTRCFTATVTSIC